MKILYILFVVPAILSVQSAFASQHSQHDDFPSDIAESLVSTALKACHSENKTGVVTAVDNGGSLVALQRDDNVGPHNTFAAQKKAYTALSTKSDTRELVSPPPELPTVVALTGRKMLLSPFRANILYCDTGSRP
ncbi:heme-binding protein [Salmonella enterica]|nr:heme-binding protein [Salmonella enterica subsp. enterica serovar Hvittingfoss]EGF6523938.1 heme-binding protein [Salmonella enterica]EHX1719572.1 heme-binding protein [Salmonella enterica subsp. enterica serovar Newport]EHL2774332.1 heme-binding protein [Salmonella enterica subsp. enterica serovar Hvittingfoss]EHL2852480.1 heme-binding protein [Salmonella enterica subsp. enterica serovar Hvittingfoss]